MKPFLNDDFLLETPTSATLYHQYVESLPIIDYHCHLSSQHIAENTQFKSITEAWLDGDHYKWRAMRANGIDESYCTGDQPDREKFMKWAETVPYTLRNPLYHWTHLELQRYFGIRDLLNPGTAAKIYDQCNEALASPENSVQNLLRKMKVEVVCTTDDPVDSLEHHRKIREDNIGITVLPAFRPDKAMTVNNSAAFNAYVSRLEEVSDKTVVTYTDYLEALKSRHDYFAEMGCTVSDHGLEYAASGSYTEFELNHIFDNLRTGQELNPLEQEKFRSALMYEFALWDHEKGWVQQYHLGAMRNNNKRMFNTIGPDTGWDSIGDYKQAERLSGFLSKLDENNTLTKTILYNLNPADNAIMATMIGNFNDGSLPGKIQYGSAWWFLDQKEGMINQLNTLSNMGLLSRFVGMLTDSRSFLSFPRHEYFRRILCDLFGKEIERGELPNDLEWTGEVLKNICYYNARQYFDFG